MTNDVITLFSCAGTGVACYLLGYVKSYLSTRDKMCELNHEIDRLTRTINVSSDVELKKQSAKALDSYTDAMIEIGQLKGELAKAEKIMASMNAFVDDWSGEKDMGKAKKELNVRRSYFGNEDIFAPIRNDNKPKQNPYETVEETFEDDELDFGEEDEEEVYEDDDEEEEAIEKPYYSPTKARQTDGKITSDDGISKRTKQNIVLVLHCLGMGIPEIVKRMKAVGIEITEPTAANYRSTGRRHYNPKRKEDDYIVPCAGTTISNGKVTATVPKDAWEDVKSRFGSFQAVGEERYFHIP